MSPQILDEAQGLFCQDPQNRKVKRSDLDSSPFTYGNLSNTIDIWVDNAEDVDISEDACNHMMDVIGECDSVYLLALRPTEDLTWSVISLTFPAERLLQARGVRPTIWYQVQRYANCRPQQPATLNLRQRLAEISFIHNHRRARL